ncbi:MAG TPA: hypothetical protein VEO53_14480 [Candidatus Binatia bacterium]|nr:hypothetical protein [Candidatus Binatia bacterium]
MAVADSNRNAMPGADSADPGKALVHPGLFGHETFFDEHDPMLRFAHLASGWPI